MAFVVGGNRRPNWAGIALRFPDGGIFTVQVAYPEVVMEAQHEYRRDSLWEVPELVETRYSIQVNGFGTGWERSGTGFHVPVAEIEARREIEE